ncbi:hypothetical protein ACIQLJ_04545 [Microbacterium sp. NPDC091313]
MHILLGIILGALVGGVVHAFAPHRSVRGVAMAPLAGAAASAVTWSALTWAAMAEDNPLLWLGSFAAAVITTIPLVIAVSAARVRHDAAARAQLR